MCSETEHSAYSPDTMRRSGRIGNNNTACKLMTCQLFRAKCCSQAPGKHNSFIFQMSVASQLLRTFPPNTGTLDRRNRAAFGRQPCSQATCTDCKDGSASCFCFCLASGNFFLLFFLFILLHHQYLMVFQWGFDRWIFEILKILHRCPDATTGFCCNMQNIHGML